MKRRPLWTRIPFFLLGPPLFAIGVYIIYKFAVGSLRGAAIVGAGMAVWLIGSLI